VYESASNDGGVHPSKRNGLRVIRVSSEKAPGRRVRTLISRCFLSRGEYSYKGMVKIYSAREPERSGRFVFPVAT
jgi:hypothetical protein